MSSKLSHGSQWRVIPNVKAADIGVGANGLIYYIGPTENGNGNDMASSLSPYGPWTVAPGLEGISISVAPDGTPYYVNSIYDIYRGNQQLPGTAIDISVGANGDIWVVGTDSGALYKFENNTFMIPVPLPDGEYGYRVAVDPGGNPWVVSANGYIFFLENGAWARIPGLAADIAVGADGSVWIVAMLANISGGADVFRWNPDLDSKWDQVECPAGTTFARLAVMPDGTPLVIHAPTPTPGYGSIGTWGAYPLGTLFEWA